MLVENLIKVTHQTNQQLVDFIAKDLRDATILAELDNFSKIVIESLQKIEKPVNQENQLKNTL